MKVKNASFVTTVVSGKDLRQDLKNEFAFVGRSNVGKSSLINALTNQNRLAKTSSTPGLTKNINYFSINNGEFHIVDLPGYGYHKAGKNEEEKWSTLLEEYFLNSPNLKCVFVLVDSRHLLSELDKVMLSFLLYHQIPYLVVATKIDKLKNSEKNSKLEKLANDARLTRLNIIAVSSEKKLGLDDVLTKMEQFIE